MRKRNEVKEQYLILSRDVKDLKSKIEALDKVQIRLIEINENLLEVLTILSEKIRGKE